MKLHEFTDRLYAMGSIEQNNKNRKLNESLNEMVQREDMREFMGDFIVAMNSLNDKWNPGTWQLENAFEWYIDRCEDTEEDEEWLAAQEEIDESLKEARNPENDEVNAVLRKWANSDRNRISKHDQKVLDDAGIKLKTDKYDAPHKYAVHKDNESDILDLHRMDKRHIRNTHPDHDLANDLATTGRHWSNRDRYNKNNDPRFPWRDDKYRSETPEESDALRPYSDKYKSLKRAVDNSESYPYWHADAEKNLDDFRAKIGNKKNK